jgi:ABC-type lipoprotein release transport system permease subunit
MGARGGILGRSGVSGQTAGVRVGGVLLALKSELRRRKGALLFAILIVGIAGGATMTAVAGARRSDSAYARFRVWARTADFSASSSAEDPAQVKKDLAKIERAPFMGEFAHVVGADASVRKPGGQLFLPFQIQVLGDRDNLLARETFEREKVLRGRHADPASANETTVSFSTGERLGVDVGDTIEIVPFGGAPIPVKVVGVVTRGTEIPTVAGSPRRSVGLTSAFMRAHPDLFGPGNDSLLFRLKPGATSEAAASWFRSEFPDGVPLFPTTTVIPGVEDTVRVETVAWWMVSGVLALIFFVLVGLLLLRNASAVADDVATMVTMGMTRRRIIGLGAVRGMLVGVFGALVAVVIAVVASPLTPAGLARLIEPAPGIRVDRTVLLLGALAVLAVTTVFGAGAAWRAHELTRAGAVRGHPLPLPSANVPLFAGLALLFRPFQRREQAVTRITIASLALVIATIVAVASTLAGLDRVQHNARLVGATWDGYVQVDDPATDAQIDTALRTVKKLPNVERATLGGFVPVPRPHSDNLMGVQLFDDPSTIGPAIVAGRAPRTALEVAMGGDEMRKFGVDIGDRFRFQPDPEGKAEALEVVGRSVLVPPLNYDAGPGDGMAATTQLAERFGLRRNEAVPFVLVRFKQGVDVDAGLDQAKQAVDDAANPDEPHAFAVTSHDRTVSDGIQRVGAVPRGLMAFLAILGIVALVQLLLVSTRRRRLHIGVLRALGLTRPQVMSLAAVQAFAVAVVATVVGLPLGLVIGHTAWRWFADALNVVPVTTRPVAAITVMLAVIAVAALVAAVPAGVQATRSRAADVLRTD